MLILFCCCFFYKLAAKDTVLLLKPMGFGLCWSGWSAGRGISLGSAVKETSLWGRQCKSGWEPPVPNPNYVDEPASVFRNKPQRSPVRLGSLDCLSSGNSPPYKQRCGKAGVMARVIPSKETEKWETLHQLGQEAWLLRLSSLCFGDSGLGQAGWGEKYHCHRQLEHSAGIHQQHRPRPHLCSWGLLIVVKGSRDRERKNLFYAKLTVKLWNTSNRLHLKERVWSDQHLDESDTEWHSIL